jgi:hypothetical protein
MVGSDDCFANALLVAALAAVAVVVIPWSLIGWLIWKLIA